MIRHRLHGEFARRALSWGARTLPQPAKVCTMPLWAGIPFLLLPDTRRRIARNLARVLGPAAAPIAGARAYRLLVAYAQSLANAYAVHAGRPLPGRVTIEGAERLAAARARGGIVLATGHIGPWQLGPHLLAQAGVGPIVLAMAREPDAAAQRFEESLALRGRFRVVATDTPFAGIALLAALRAGEVVAMQMDRAGIGACVAVSCLGGSASFPVGPAALARAGAVPIVPVFLLAAGPSDVRIEIGEPIEPSRTDARDDDLRAATQALADAYDRCVRAHPYQWYHFDDFGTSA
jgi:KDO2-lipid IV(A) lauroyltransferase